MISRERLLAALTDGRVAFDAEGTPVDLPEVGLEGHAYAVVVPVTDAVKQMRGDVVESLDRGGMWVVEVMVLDREVIEALGQEEMTAQELWQAVTDIGRTWQLSSTSSP